MQKIQFTFVLFAFAALFGCDSKPVELRMVTPIEPVDREIAQDFSDLMASNESVTIELTSQPQSEESAIASLLAGDADLALIHNNMSFRADITTVIPFYPTVLHIGYTLGRDASTAIDLIKGATVFAGEEGSASRQVFEQMIGGLKLSTSDFSYAANPFMSRDTGAQDVFVVFAPISPDRLEPFPDVRLFSIGTPDDIGRGSTIDAATMLNPEFEAFVIPEGIYDKATPGPVVTIAVDMLLVARRDLDDAVVYDLVQQISGLRPAMASRKPGLLQGRSSEVDASNSTFVLHPGLVAYMQRDAPSVYERYSGIAEVAVTLLIALASALIAGVKIYRIRRKNRIDVFYSEAITIRDSVTDASRREEKETAVRRIGDLQTKAFDMLVNEQLAADESFRIFITLSNDIIRRLESN